MFTVEEYIVICMAALTGLLVFYAVIYAICHHIRAKIDAQREQDEIARLKAIGNDLNPFSHHGRG